MKAPLFRQVILASAGSGKTFQLSSRYLELLVRGEAPESILATTFTRKAAGEILERVMERLAEAALDEDRARELGTHVGRPLTSDLAQEILLGLVRQLNRLQVGTLDSFFIRAAGSFAMELGLPTGWRIGDPPTARRIESEALGEVLAAADPAAIVELFRALNRGSADRSVHDRILGRWGSFSALLSDARELDPGAVEPWRWDGGVELLTPPGEAALRERLARSLEGMALPTTAAGEPNRSWAKAVESAAAAVRDGDWTRLIDQGPVCKLLEGADSYGRAPFGPEQLPVLEEVLEGARRALATTFAGQLAAMGRLVGELLRALEGARREAAAYRFDDITFLLSGAGSPLEAHPTPEVRLALYYRLDARIRHLLLDEFQDTSLPQWWALEPLAEELLSGGEGDRAALVVADPKQSIYGWRGGEPRLLRRIGEHFALEKGSLRESWRSSRVVLDAVNRVFSGLAASSGWAGEAPELLEAVRRWEEDFEEHRPARPELEGEVRLIVAPQDPGARRVRPAVLGRAAELVAELRSRHPGATIGVLTRTNEAVRRLIHELRVRDVEASDEGGSAVTDSGAVVALLAVLRLADHPGDRIARYLVATSPVGEVIGLTDAGVPWEKDRWMRADREARLLSHRVRARLMDEGYGPVFAGWVRSLEPRASPRDRRRMRQLVELAFRFQAEATLRPEDFLHFVDGERVEDPTSALVRVMTVHRSKGLEFDVVVLPELGGRMTESRGAPAYPWRQDPMGRITAFKPGVPRRALPLFPDVQEASRAGEQAAVRDALSHLYVAMTRARHGLHLLVEDPGEDSKGKRRSVPTGSHARIVAEVLGGISEEEDWDRVRAGAVLYQAGDPDWCAPGSGPPPPTDPEARPPLRLHVPQSERPRTRLLPRARPSDLEGASRVDLSWVMRLDRGDAAVRGTVAHAWCEAIEWLDPGVDGHGAPSDQEMGLIARRVAPDLAPSQVQALVSDFRGWLRAPAVAEALRRPSSPGEFLVERELPVLHRENGRILEGVVDRVVVRLEAGKPVAAWLYDFKTERLPDPETLQARVRDHEPQLRAYQRAVTARYRLAPDLVEARLVFLAAGVVSVV